MFERIKTYIEDAFFGVRNEFENVQRPFLFTVSLDENGEVVSSGASSALSSSIKLIGDEGEYSNVKGEFTASVIAGTKNIVILNWRHTISLRSIRSIFLYTEDPINPGWTLIQAVNLSITNYTVTGNIITLNGLPNVFNGTEQVEINLVGPDKYANYSLDAKRVIDINSAVSPASSLSPFGRFSAWNSPGAGLILEPFSFPSGHSNIDFVINQIGGTGFTLTLWKSCNENAPITDFALSDEWFDITNDVFGVAQITQTTGKLYGSKHIGKPALLGIRLNVTGTAQLNTQIKTY